MPDMSKTMTDLTEEAVAIDISVEIFDRSEKMRSAVLRSEKIN